MVVAPCSCELSAATPTTEAANASGNGQTNTAKSQYTAADALFLQEVANQVAMAIENMKAYEEISALKARLERENVYLQEEIGTEHNFADMIGASPVMLELMRIVERVAPTDSTVLMSGE